MATRKSLYILTVGNTTVFVKGTEDDMINFRARVLQKALQSGLRARQIYVSYSIVRPIEIGACAFTVTDKEVKLV